ncbi:MAG: prepilin peptidase [Candidatus Eisenbacteria bacterium]|nr:prepilin peptidase [Candidatus Eisenbacteria bacterium]
MERFIHMSCLFVLGAVMGSFLNVCIHRIPRGMSIVTPRSHCPKCLAKIRAVDNIPVLSYIILRGRCRVCHERISLRYIAVELLLGVLFVLGGIVFEPGWRLFFLLAFISLVLSSIMTDLELRIIPDRFSLTGLGLGVIFALFLDGNWVKGIGGAIFGGGSLFLVGWAYKRFRGIDGMGGGDIKMAAMIGAFLGMGGAFYSIFFASLAGSLYGIASIVLKKGTMKTELPFGVFLGISSVAVLFCQELLLIRAIPALWGWG